MWLVPHRAVALLDLIEQLPESCRWREAAANDVEFLRWERTADAPTTSGGKWSPRISEFTLESYLLVQLVNLVGTLASDKRLRKFSPLTGPTTAHRKAAQISEASDLAEMFAALTPKRKG